MIEPARLKIGQTFDREKLQDLLYDLRYKKQEFVSRPGEFAVRGGIVDIYPVTYRAPVRLEFEGETIHSIRDFSPLDGRTLTRFEEVFLIPVTESFEKKLSRFRERFENFEPLTEARDLEPGDYVVHLKYGIGRYLGTETIQIKGKKQKHLALEYADREILYLNPREPLERYIGGEGHAPKLTKLHTKEWEKIKEKTRQAVHHIAQDLL